MKWVHYWWFIKQNKLVLSHLTDSTIPLQKPAIATPPSHSYKALFAPRSWSTSWSEHSQFAGGSQELKDGKVQLSTACFRNLRAKLGLQQDFWELKFSAAAQRPCCLSCQMGNNKSSTVKHPLFNDVLSCWTRVSISVQRSSKMPGAQ